MKRKVKCYVTYTMDFEVEADDDEGAMEAARKQLLPTEETDPYNWLWFSLKSLSEIKIQTGAEQGSWQPEDLRWQPE
mgnify:CR=1 FL=1